MVGSSETRCANQIHMWTWNKPEWDILIERNGLGSVAFAKYLCVWAAYRVHLIPSLFQPFEMVNQQLGNILSELFIEVTKLCNGERGDIVFTLNGIDVWFDV